jgi:dihydrofolate reductase
MGPELVKHGISLASHPAAKNGQEAPGSQEVRGFKSHRLHSLETAAQTTSLAEYSHRETCRGPTGHNEHPAISPLVSPFVSDDYPRGGTVMSRVRVHNFSISLDGFGTGDGQTLESPFGHAGSRLHEWFFPTRTFRRLSDPQGAAGGSTGVDDAFASNWATNIGVEIMGRNKFGPQRGPWADEEWKGWWGDDPPFHTPVYVLTHHQRPSVEMAGGTTFHFVDATPSEALKLAEETADGLDIRIGGGPSTIREFLAANLIDYMHVAIVPIVLGRGERLWDGLEGLEERFEVESVSSPSGVTHLTFTRR